MRILPPVPIEDDAEFGDDGKCRYWLTRKLSGSGPVGLFMGLNPSTAGASQATNDHTVRKWCGFGERWGWSGFIAVNPFAHIETKSEKLAALSYEQAVGPENDRVLRAVAQQVATIVLCWGNNVPQHLNRRISEVTALLTEENPLAAVCCFGLSKEGAPLHPLRLGYDTPLVPYVPRQRATRRE